MNTFIKISRFVPLCLIVIGCVSRNNGEAAKLDYDPWVHSDTSSRVNSVQVEVVDGIVPRTITTSLPRRYKVRAKVIHSSASQYKVDGDVIISSFQSSYDYYFTNGSRLVLCVDATGKLMGIVANQR